MFPTQPQRPGPPGGPAPSMAPGASAAAPGGAPGGDAPQQPQQVPPDMARHIDPKNPMQMLLLQRVDKLQPQDLQALGTIPPPAAQSLKKIIPELGFLIDKYILNQGGQGGDPMQPGGGMPQAPGGAQPGGGAPPAQGAPAVLQRPGTRLNDM